MGQELMQMTCSACRGDEAPLAGQELDNYLAEVPGWDLVEEDGIKKLTRTFKFKNFVDALTFTIQVGKVAEEEGHHPIITLTWGRASVTWYTHKIEGLHHNDFIMAAKTDRLYADN
jgi:4a-hydroxytetrahydrobiopterin dehydratase